MTNSLQLNVKFNDATIPQHVLDLLAESARNIILSHFSEKVLKSENIDPKTPYVYPEEDLQFKTIAYAKDAFDRHRVSPYPSDEVQLVLKEIDLLTIQPLARDLGPSATRHLHPVVSFPQG